MTPGDRPNVRRLMVLTGLAALTASLLAFPAYAQDKTAEVDRIFSWMDDLKAFAGRYGNDENKVVFEMTPANAGLTARVSWNESQPFQFVPVDRDTFQFRGMIVRFTRDDTGAVMGMDYSNPVVRNIKFTRVR